MKEKIFGLQEKITLIEEVEEGEAVVEIWIGGIEVCLKNDEWVLGL
jgi:hypothetical protein